MEGTQIAKCSRDSVSIEPLPAVQNKVLSDLTKNLAQTTLQEVYELIETVEAMPAVTLLFILTWKESILIIQIHVAPQKKTYLIDIHTLGSKAFDTTGALGHSLRSVLQSGSIPKVFFDVRNDSDALFSHFKISLAGIIDLQVMEYGTRSFRKGFVSGLSKCIERSRFVLHPEIRMSAGERRRTQFVCSRKRRSLRSLQPAAFVGCDRLVLCARRAIDRVKELQSSSYVGHGKQKAVGRGRPGIVNEVLSLSARKYS